MTWAAGVLSLAGRPRGHRGWRADWTCAIIHGGPPRRHPWPRDSLLKVPDLLWGDPGFLGAAVEAVAVFACFAVLGALLAELGGRSPDILRIT